MEALTTRDIEDKDKLAEVLEEYKRFKRNYAENLVFDPEKSFLNRRQIVPLAEKEYAPLQLIQIYFDSNTFDEIQRGLKLRASLVLLEARWDFSQGSPLSAQLRSSILC